MKTKGDKYLVGAMAFMAVMIMSIVYAAFANTISITTTSNTGGGAWCVTTSISCTSTTGLSGATAPTVAFAPSAYTCVSTVAQTYINATLYQPGDKITCTVYNKNTNPFNIKTTAATACSTSARIVGTAAAPVDISVGTLAANLALAPNSVASYSVVVSFYSAAAQGNPSTKTASVTCSTTWVQA